MCESSTPELFSRSWCCTAAARRPRCSQPRRAAQPVESNSGATPWLGATPPSQRPRGPPLVVAVRRTMLALQLCATAHAFLLEQHLRRTRRCRGGARTTSGVVRRTVALGESSFWRTWRPHAQHFSADSLFHGLPMCSVFRSEPKSHKHDQNFVSSLHSLSITFFLFLNVGRFFPNF